MSFITMEVEIDHGRVSTIGQGKLPAKAKCLLTILESAENPPGVNSQIKALEELQSRLNLDMAGAKKWMETVKSARR